MINIKKIFIIALLIFLSSSGINAQLLYDDFYPSEKEYDYTLSGYRFNKLDIKYYFQNTTPDLSGGVQQAAIREAFEIWCSSTPLTFTETFSSTDADITILFAAGDHGDGNPFDGTNNILAHAFLPFGSTYTGNAADIHFDEDETWTISTRPNHYQPIDIVTVAAHEIGHSLGLLHSANPNALMYESYNGSHRYLHQDDIDGILSCYNMTAFTSSYTLTGTASLTQFQHYKGSNNFQTSGSVTISGGSAYVSFKAPSITLNSGFSVTSSSGSYFLATNEYDCLLSDGDDFFISENELKQDIFNESSTPLDFELYQNDPNPFNPVTTIRYSIPIDSKVSIKVYDILGKEITELVNEYKQPGNYSVSFNAGNYSSGIYFYRIVAGNFTKSFKMVLSK